MNKVLQKPQSFVDWHSVLEKLDAFKAAMLENVSATINGDIVVITGGSALVYFFDNPDNIIAIEKALFDVTGTEYKVEYVQKNLQNENTKAETLLTENQTLKFQNFYKFKKHLNSGGTGKTILMHDDIISRFFVCKKFEPHQQNEAMREKCYNNFVEETKILYNTYHKNVVRVFNHMILPDEKLGYIIMEYIVGQEIDAFLSSNPFLINDVFLQAIDGFCHLEEIGILHRDIKGSNILVSTENNTVKIIDFGFGKIIEDEEDLETSIYLNWTEGGLPTEITNDKKYAVETDVYFLGRLFQKIIDSTGNKDFLYTDILADMTEPNREKRIRSFIDIKRQITLVGNFFISDDNKAVYKNLADNLYNSIGELYEKPVFVFDDETIIRNLRNIVKHTQWEDEIKNIAKFVNCFFSQINAQYVEMEWCAYGNEQYERTVAVQVINEFIEMFCDLSKSERINLLENLYYNRIDTIPITPKQRVVNNANQNVVNSTVNDEDYPF